MEMASKLVVAAVILHNLAIQFGDNWEDDDTPSG